MIVHYSSLFQYFFINLLLSLLSLKILDVLYASDMILPMFHPKGIKAHVTTDVI